ncbi:hypothetical protein [Candidatus Magnetaquicoccus inordinatus]|uniref:hypothetical protein n=1 Tax=Candidatus Magnetaquicoccus inordinatus TaxID=2496818 RepID=UPI00102AD72E|nr:hypothetical protein [Candidatus Magnetaquicoccus inordinatus]
MNNYSILLISYTNIFQDDSLHITNSNKLVYHNKTGGREQDGRALLAVKGYIFFILQIYTLFYRRKQHCRRQNRNCNKLFFTLGTPTVKKYLDKVHTRQTLAVKKWPCQRMTFWRNFSCQFH